MNFTIYSQSKDIIFYSGNLILEIPHDSLKRKAKDMLRSQRNFAFSYAVKACSLLSLLLVTSIIHSQHRNEQSSGKFIHLHLSLYLPHLHCHISIITPHPGRTCFMTPMVLRTALGTTTFSS